MCKREKQPFSISIHANLFDLYLFAYCTTYANEYCFLPHHTHDLNTSFFIYILQMSEGISIEYLDQTIRHRLEATHVEIIDTSGKCHIHLAIKSFITYCLIIVVRSISVLTFTNPFRWLRSGFWGSDSVQHIFRQKQTTPAPHGQPSPARRNNVNSCIYTSKLLILPYHMSWVLTIFVIH